MYQFFNFFYLLECFSPFTLLFNLHTLSQSENLSCLIMRIIIMILTLIIIIIIITIIITILSVHLISILGICFTFLNVFSVKCSEFHVQCSFLFLHSLFLVSVFTFRMACLCLVRIHR